VVRERRWCGGGARDDLMLGVVVVSWIEGIDASSHASALSDCRYLILTRLFVYLFLPSQR
jgi:hypothetical protein